MARRKKAEITEMIEQINIIPDVKDTEDELPFVIEHEDNATPDYKGDYVVVVDVDNYLRIRSGAGKDKPIIGKLDAGSIVKCIGNYAVDSDDNIWLDIGNGFVMLDFLKKL